MIGLFVQPLAPQKSVEERILDFAIYVPAFTQKTFTLKSQSFEIQRRTRRGAVMSGSDFESIFGTRVRRCELISAQNILVWRLKKVFFSVAVGETHHDINIDAGTPSGAASNGRFAHRCDRTRHPRVLIEILTGFSRSQIRNFP